jgi:multimeric flavodoxin WrbA
MRITAFNGSPKGPQGNTHIMVREFLKGAQEAGAETENIFLVQKKIHHCMGCFTCWMKTPGKCIYNDDMPELVEKMRDSDLVVFACPVYIGDVTGIMKDFLDRSIVGGVPHMETGENGVTRHVTKKENARDVVLISNCGFPERLHFDFFKNPFKYLEMNCSINIIAEIYLAAGPMLSGNVPELKQTVENYLALLNQAGREIVENRRLMDTTEEALVKPLIPTEAYLMGANAYFNEVLATRGS